MIYMRVALFGGTFDPIHRGHLAIASAAADAFGLDRVLFAPTGHQPLKSGAPLASFADRLAMVRLACADVPRFEACDLEMPRPDGSANFTVDTLSALHRLFPNDALFNLAGADSFLTLRGWRDPDRLLELAEWLVVSRPGTSIAEEEIAALGLTAAQRARVHLLATVHEDISATGLRQRLRDGKPCEGMLTPAVAAYIQAQGLYR
jgi:nicotinate-nucleotide adenylyltransferase